MCRPQVGQSDKMFYIEREGIVVILCCAFNSRSHYSSPGGLANIFLLKGVLKKSIVSTSLFIT